MHILYVNSVYEDELREVNAHLNSHHKMLNRMQKVKDALMKNASDVVQKITDM